MPALRGARGGELSGNFPDFERVLPKEHAHSVKLEKEELRGTIERVAQFSDERSRAIRRRWRRAG